MLVKEQKFHKEYVEIMEDVKSEEGETPDTAEGKVKIGEETAVKREEFKPEVDEDAIEHETHIPEAMPEGEEARPEGEEGSTKGETKPEGVDVGTKCSGEKALVETEEVESGLQAGTEAKEAKPDGEEKAKGEEVRPKGEEAEGEIVKIESGEAEGNKVKAKEEEAIAKPEGEEADGDVAKPEGEEAESDIGKPEGEEAEGDIAKAEGEEAEGDIVKPEGEEAEDDIAKPEAKSVEDTVTRVGDFYCEDIALQPEVQLGYSDSEEEEEEEEEAEVEEKEEVDRDELIERYKKLQYEGRPIVQKNVLLLKKLAEYFKKCKMEHVYKHPEHYSADKELRYHKQLLAFDDIRKTEANERERITRELEELKLKKNTLVGALKGEVDSLIQKERSIGIGLINTQTSKVIPDRLVEHLLSRQMRKIKEISEVRLAFIKLHECVAAKNAQLKALETFGSNLHLIDYEQLRMQNQSFADKIEERDEELQRLRLKATSAIQSMAHMKEKSHAKDEKLDELCELIDYTATEVNNARGYVRDMKKRRDWLRAETLRLRQESGLLAHPPLLRHFEKSIDEATLLSAQVQNFKNAFYDQKRNLAELREAIVASGGREPTVCKTARYSSLLPLAELQRKSTSADRRKSVKVTPPSFLNQLSTADQMRCRASKASRSVPVSLASPITPDRPSFFPSLAKENFYKKSSFLNLNA